MYQDKWSDDPIESDKSQELLSPEKLFPALTRFKSAGFDLHGSDIVNELAEFKMQLYEIIIKATTNKLHPNLQDQQEVFRVPNALALEPTFQLFQYLNKSKEEIIANFQDGFFVFTDLTALQFVDRNAGSNAGDLYVVAGIEAQLRAMYELCSNQTEDKNIPLGATGIISGDESVSFFANNGSLTKEIVEATINKHMQAILDTPNFQLIKDTIMKSIKTDKDKLVYAKQIALLGTNAKVVPLKDIPMPNHTDHRRSSELLTYAIDFAERSTDTVPLSSEKQGVFLRELIQSLLKRKRISDDPPGTREMVINHPANIFPPSLEETLNHANIYGRAVRRDWEIPRQDNREPSFQEELFAWGLADMTVRTFDHKPPRIENSFELRVVYQTEYLPEVAKWWAENHGFKEIAVSMMTTPQLKSTNKDLGHLEGDLILNAGVDYIYKVSDELLQNTNDRKTDVIVFQSRGSFVIVSTPEHTAKLQQELIKRQLLNREEDRDLPNLPKSIQSETYRPLDVFVGAQESGGKYIPLEILKVNDPDFTSNIFRSVDNLRKDLYINERLWTMLYKPEPFIRVTGARAKTAVTELSNIYSWMINETDNLMVGDATNQTRAARLTINPQNRSQFFLPRLKIDDSSHPPLGPTQSASI